MISVWALTLVATSKTPILTYHDIIPKRTSSSVWFDCTVQEFKDQIAWLKKQGAVFISTEQVYQALSRRKPLPAKAICITFADNYQGFYRYAWPILQKEKIPTTQFVHTGFVGATNGRPKMTWSQLIELDRSGLVTIASQTVSHPVDLTRMKDTEILSEFTKSRTSLSLKLGHAVKDLAYPNGKFDSRVAELARKAGYRMAFTEDCKAAESAQSLLMVPRYVHTKYRKAWKDNL